MVFLQKISNVSRMFYFSFRFVVFKFRMPMENYTATKSANANTTYTHVIVNKPAIRLLLKHYIKVAKKLYQILPSSCRSKTTHSKDKDDKTPLRPFRRPDSILVYFTLLTYICSFTVLWMFASY